ncbi:MAG TPA: methionyl-tRNA formyltransferase [Thermoanaerobaculia bacterium]|nr:methionyl-tRNA formyltransferase [Thermoanaerobaculia bacterium]
MRIAYFGTPQFAVPSLAALIESGFDVPLVVTQPDRPVGRSGRPRPSPVAELAEARGIAVAKPSKIRGNAAFLDTLREAQPDAIAVVAYGKILPDEILELPPKGCVNVHASLLPRHRGASPIQAAILAGDRETGISTMKIVSELDAGPVYLVRKVSIGDREDAASLADRLARLGGELLVETLHGVAAGTLVPKPQTGEPTFSRPLTREDARVDWSRPASEIERRLRAFTPWPGLYAHLGGERVKLIELEAAAPGRAGEPGTLRDEKGWPVVEAGEGSALVLKKVQRAGRKPVTGREFFDGLQPRPARFDVG